MKPASELTEAFRARGLRMTPQRQCIFRLLEDNAGHPTAEWLYKRARAEMPTISLKTVYQTLNELASMGEIRALDLGTGAARFDPNVAQHHHLVCDRCGATADVELDTSSLRPPDSLDGFVTGSAEVVFRGICGRCSAGWQPAPVQSTQTQTTQTQTT